MLARHVRSSDRFANVARDLVALGRLDETFVDHYEHPQSFGATTLQLLGASVQADSLTLEWEHLTGRI